MTEAAANSVPLRSLTTLRAGGNAERFVVASDVDRLAQTAILAHRDQDRLTILGWGSNVLPSDAGVPGLVVHNRARRIEIRDDGQVLADTGCGFQELSLKAAQAGLAGLEFAVGIPGTLGGALVSNAGAYRSNVSEYLVELEVVLDGRRMWTGPEIMHFSYRDSVLRRPNRPALALLRVRFQLPRGERKRIFDEARDYQRQRIAKQPPPASAGSFFKNVVDPILAMRMERLPEPLKAAGVVPAGFLIQDADLAGLRHKGAMFSRRHANFIVNTGRATATAIRELADLGAKAVYERHGVRLEEEVLYIGDWTAYRAT